jgi:hypothetical protein
MKGWPPPMKILFDTNIIVDILGYREPFFYYLMRKYYMDADQALNSIIDIL